MVCDELLFQNSHDDNRDADADNHWEDFDDDGDDGDDGNGGDVRNCREQR